MSIFASRPKIFQHVEPEHHDRRGFLAGLASTLAIPVPSWFGRTTSPTPTGRKCSHLTPSPAGPVPTPLDTVDEETGRRLVALWEAVKATWPAERKARRLLRCVLKARRKGKDVDYRPFHEAHFAAGRERDTAMFHLMKAIFGAADYRRVDEDRWHHYGAPLASVRFRSLLFLVHACDQAEYSGLFPGDHGMTDCVVIDLAEIGGGR